MTEVIDARSRPGPSKAAPGPPPARRTTALTFATPTSGGHRCPAVSGGILAAPARRLPAWARIRDPCGLAGRRRLRCVCGDDTEYPWGAEPTPGGEHRANVWQGDFLLVNLAADGYDGRPIVLRPSVPPANPVVARSCQRRDRLTRSR